jgi:hypothetical protein
VIGKVFAVVDLWLKEVSGCSNINSQFKIQSTFQV